MLTQHNRKTARLSPDYTFAIHELGVWSGDETSAWFDLHSYSQPVRAANYSKVYRTDEFRDPCMHASCMVIPT